MLSPLLMQFHALHERITFSESDLHMYNYLKQVAHEEQSVFQILSKFPHIHHLKYFYYHDVFHDYYFNCIFIHQDKLYIIKILVTKNFCVETELMRMRHFVHLLKFVIGENILIQPIIINEYIEHPNVYTQRDLHHWFLKQQFPSKDIQIHFQSSFNRLTLKKQSQIIEKLKAIHYHPIFDFQQLNNGTRCPNCQRINQLTKYKQLVYCNHCQTVSSSNTVFLNMIKEFQIIYPNKKLTSAHLYHFCNGLYNRRTVLKLMNQSLIQNGTKKGRYYTYPLENFSV